MLLMRPPGVYPAQGDTAMLTDALRAVPLLPGSRVLDLGTGTGAIAMAAARLGAAHVTAVDISLRAVIAARLNSGLRRLPVDVLHGDLFTPVTGRTFDVIVANPPYVPGNPSRPGRHASARAWDAGTDGRQVVDQICAQAPAHLTTSGTLLMVHSALCDAGATLERLRDAGLRARVLERRQEPFGPVMRGRAGTLEALGLIRPGQRQEELVVIRADRVHTAVRVRAA